jgi:methionine-rich copper-binding protein CopC
MNYPKLRFIKRSLLLWVIILAQFFSFLPVKAISATSFTPADNGTPATLGANLSVSFDMNWYNNSFGWEKLTIFYSNGSILEEFEIATSNRLTGSGTSTLTIDPTNDLPAGQSLYVRIDDNAIGDDPGWSFNFYSITNNGTWNFSTSDTTAPVLSKLRPADNTNQVLRDQNLIITFNEAIDLQSGNITIKKLSDNSTVETIGVTSGNVSGNGTASITINPSNNLDFNTNYYINIANGAVKDLSGNNYAGFTSNGTWNFKTETNGSWLDADWTRRLKITTDSTTVNGTQSNFPVYVNLANLPSSFFDYVQPDGKDIRVTLANGTTLVPHEVVWLSTTQNAGELHFKANSLAGNDNTAFYIYFGNTINGTPAEGSTYGAQNVWNGNSYVGVWHMNEDPDSGIIKDSSTKSTNGTPYNLSGEDPVTAKVGKGIDFDGSAEYISMGDVSSVDFGASDFSFSAWFKQDVINGQGIIIGKDYANLSSERQFEVRTDTSNMIRVSYWKTNDDWVYFDTNSSYVSANTWTQIFTVRNGNSFEIYKNGVLYSSGTTSGTHGTMDSTTAQLRIGNRENPAGINYFDGILDEVKAASTSFSSSWINTEYNNQSDPNEFYNVSSLIKVEPDVSNPIISSLSPADGSSSVDVETNLIIGFSEPVDVQSGNIYIKKLSDNSTIQTINVSSVTGNGTANITINPNDLNGSTSYYVTIDNTAFDDLVGNSFSGFSDNGTWNFTTGGSWYNGDWLHRKKITVQHSKVNGDLTDFPVYLDLNLLGADFFNDIKNDGSDIVITQSDKTTKLNRELVWLSTNDNKGELHFKAPNLYNTSNSIFYIYYGNSNASETNSTSTWNSNYKSVVHLQETPTASNTDYEFIDSTSNNNNGKSLGTMGSSDKIAGNIGNGIDLDGSNDYIDFGDITSISNANGFTLSTWIKPIGTSGYLPIFAKGTNSVISLMHDGTNWKGSSLSGSADSLYHTKNLARNSNWIYSVIVFDSSQVGNDRFKIYTNGNLLTSMTFSTINDKSGGVGENLFAGYQNSTNYSYYSNGDLDEIRVSTATHTAPWIKTEYFNQSSPNTFFSIGSKENGSVGDTTAPTILTLSPLDGSSNVAIDTNLIISFSESVDTQSGNLVIKKSGGTTVQTISISSATGNGTSTLTINPSDLANNTSYYVQIDATAIDDLAGNSFAGISDTTTWNFTTAQIPGWMNNNWTKRVKFTVDDSKVNGSVTDFPVYLKLNDFSSKNIFNDTRSDGGDIRITQGDGMSVLASELVQFNAVSNLGELHFKAPHLSNTSNMDFYMYYGNSVARPINASDPLGKHDVWSNGFVAVYHMQEDPNADSSNSIYNSARNKYYGTPYGSMTSSDRVAGQLGNGTDFDGTNDYYDTDDISEIDNATKLTYSTWFKRRSTGSKILMGKGSTTITDMSDIHVWNDGSVYLQWRNGKQNTASFASNDSNWHHLVSVFNGTGTTSVIKIIAFLDGNQKTLNFSGGTPTKLSINSSRFVIGKRNLDNDYSDGFIDEIRVANKLRNINWARTEFNNQNSPSSFYSVVTSAESNTSNNQPKISNLYPANQAQQVPLKANLKITFNENISANAGNIVIKKLSDGSTFETIAIGSTSISGNTITINPTSDFAANTEYYVLLDGSLIEGSCGDPECKFPGISTNRGWRFKTTGPHIKEVIFHDTNF